MMLYLYSIVWCKNYTSCIGIVSVISSCTHVLFEINNNLYEQTTLYYVLFYRIAGLVVMLVKVFVYVDLRH